VHAKGPVEVRKNAANALCQPYATGFGRRLGRAEAGYRRMAGRGLPAGAGGTVNDGDLRCPDAASGMLPYSLEQASFFGPDPVTSPSTGLTLRLDGPLDAAALSEAVSLLQARHEGLRFRTDEAHPARGQRISAPEAIKLAPVPVTEEQMWDRLEHDGRAPFDLAAAGPVRFRLYRARADLHYLAMTAHPAALDAWGVGIANRDLWALYYGRGSGSGARLPDLPLSFGDHVRKQHSYGAALAGPQRDRFLERLAALRLGPLPMSAPARAAAAPSLMFPRETFCLDRQLLAGIARTARELAVTPSATFLAGFELVLGMAAESTVGGLSCIYMGRDQMETRPMAAALARRVPLRFSFTQNMQLGDFFRKVMLDWAAAIEDSGPPYSAARLVQAAGGPLDVLEPVFNLRMSRSMVRVQNEDPDEGPTGTALLTVKRAEAGYPKPAPMWPQFGRDALFALVTLGAEARVTAVYDPLTVPEQAARPLFAAYQQVMRVLAGGAAHLTIGELAGMITAYPAGPAWLAAERNNPTILE